MISVAISRLKADWFDDISLFLMKKMEHFIEH